MSASGSAPTLADHRSFRRTCCCCIPARAGVIFFGLLGLLGGAVIAAAGIYKLIHHQIGGSKLALIIQVVSYILLALISLVGLIGAISRRLGCIKAFFIILIIHLLASIGTGIYAIRLVFREGPDYLSQCQALAGSAALKDSAVQDAAVLKGCQKSFTLLKAFVIAIYIGAWLIQIWATTVVFGYMKQLDDEEKAKKAMKVSETW